MSRELPPNDYAAEAAVIAATILDPKLRVIASKLVPEHFYNRVHSTLWRGVVAAHATGCVDAVTVASELIRLGCYDEVPKGYLIELLNSVPSIADGAWKAYEQTVLDHSSRRHALVILQRAEADIYSGFEGSVAARVQDAASDLLKAVAGQTETRTVTYDSAVTYYVRDAKGRHATRLSTGLSKLDDALGGLYPADLTILAARPGMGKTSLGAQICAAVAKQGKRALFISLEMAAEELYGRALSSASGVPFGRLRRGDIKQEDYVPLQLASEAIRDAQRRLDVVDMTAPKLEQVRAAVLQHVAKTGPVGVVCIDYLQLMSLGNDRDVVNSIAKITSGLKSLAKELSVPVILLSQLNRGVESRDNKRPAMSDLRSSGSIEQDADNIVMIYRPGYYATPRELSGEVELDLCKCRSGPPQVVSVEWDGPRMLFCESKMGGKNYEL